MGETRLSIAKKLSVGEIKGEKREAQLKMKEQKKKSHIYKVF